MYSSSGIHVASTIESMTMKLVPLMRSAALVTAVALLPVTTAGMAQVDGRAAPQFGKLYAVYQRIKANYVDTVDDEKLVRGAIDGMLASLDPHSAYLDGGDLQRLETMIGAIIRASACR